MRDVASLRISDRERALVQAAAEAQDTPWTAYLREAAVQQAARDLAGDQPDPGDAFSRNLGVYGEGEG